MTTCEIATRSVHPSLLPFASPEECHAKRSALLTEKIGEDRRAKWMEDVKARGLYCDEDEAEDE